MKRDEILNTALKATMGDRATTHGDCVDNMNHVAAMWTAYIGEKINKPLTGVDVAHMLTQLKMSRAVHGAANPDDFVDGSAYMAIAGEVALTPAKEHNWGIDESMKVLVVPNSNGARKIQKGDTFALPGLKGVCTVLGFRGKNEKGKHFLEAILKSADSRNTYIIRAEDL